jgi:hypothetical protein
MTVKATARATLGGLLAVALVSGCSSSKKKATLPASSTTPTSAAGSTTTAPGAAVASSDPVAVALNSTLLTAAEVQQVLSLPSAPTAEPAGPASTPQGPLTENGLLSVLPSAAVYKPIYDRAGGGVGANATYHSGALDIDLAAIKFATASGGRTFVEQVITLATTIAQGSSVPHPQLPAGELPPKDRVVVRVPPSQLADPTHETVATSLLYNNGVFYLITLLSPLHGITDQQVVALATAQDAKYLRMQSQLHVG